MKSIFHHAVHYAHEAIAVGYVSIYAYKAVAAVFVGH